MSTKPFFSHFQKLLLFIFLLSLFLWFISTILNIVVPLLISVLLAYIFNPIIEWMETKGAKRLKAAIILYLSSFSLIIILISFLIPVFSNEFFALQKSLPQYIHKIYGELWKWQNIIQNKFTIIKDLNILSKSLNAIQEKAMNIAGDIPVLLQNIFTWFYALFLIPFFMFFILADGPRIRKQFFSIIPNKYFEASANLLFRIDTQLGNYIRGIILEALIVGTLSTIGLFILKVKFFFIIGMFVGFANLIPYFGPFAGGVPAVLITLLDKGSISHCLWVIGLFIAIQIIDNNFISTFVLSKSISTHPVIVLLAVLIGGTWFGVWGMFFAVPALGIIKVLVVELTKEIRFRLSES